MEELLEKLKKEQELSVRYADLLNKSTKEIVKIVDDIVWASRFTEEMLDMEECPITPNPYTVDVWIKELEERYKGDVVLYMNGADYVVIAIRNGRFFRQKFNVKGMNEFFSAYKEIVKLFGWKELDSHEKTL